MSDQISILRQMFNSLSKEEQTNFLKSLNHESKQIQSFKSFKQSVIKHSNHPLQDRCCCPHCQGINVVKNGHKGNIQRFKCRDCGKTFTFSNNTILFSTKKDLETWKKYCDYRRRFYAASPVPTAVSIPDNTSASPGPPEESVFRHPSADCLTCPGKTTEFPVPFPCPEWLW